MTPALRSDATALDAVVALLAPEGTLAGRGRAYAVLPCPTRPRYLLPTAGRAAGAALIRPAADPRRDVLTRRVLRPALRLGAARLVPGRVRVADGTDADPSLRRHLAALLDRADIDLAVALGAPRPNRKPVIQAIGGDGATVAWVKLGVDDHTDRLVAHETDALTRPPSDPVVAPRVVAAGSWRGHRLLALAHLEMTETAGDLALTVPVIRAIAGPITHERATASAWWQQMRTSVATPGTDPDGRIGALLDDLDVALGTRSWPFGTWHGDLAPWNATWEGDRLHVWDWERAGGPVPLGLDLVHNRVQVALLRDGADLALTVGTTIASEADALVALGYGPGEVPLVISAYLATLRVRYAEDARTGSLGPGGPIARAIDDDADPTFGRRVTTP